MKISNQCLCLLTLVTIIVFVLLSNSSMTKPDSSNPLLLEVLRSQVAKHCPLWSRQQRLAFIDTIRLAFDETTPGDMAAKVTAFIHFFPDYLAEFPKQITTDELEFLCRRTKWHIELFLSNPLPEPEHLSQLRSQVASLILVIRDEDLDAAIVVPQEVKEKARHILQEVLMKIAQNPLFPSLKRPLTAEEILSARADILRILNQTRTSTNTALNEAELLEWYLNKISVVIRVVDVMTKPEAPQSLLEMEQEYLRLANLRNRLKEGHDYFQSVLAPSIEQIELMEILLRESLALHTVIYSSQLRFLIGY